MLEEWDTTALCQALMGMTPPLIAEDSPLTRLPPPQIDSAGNSTMHIPYLSPAEFQARQQDQPRTLTDAVVLTHIKDVARNQAFAHAERYHADQDTVDNVVRPIRFLIESCFGGDVAMAVSPDVFPG